jgi:alcohol dehydrogenase
MRSLVLDGTRRLAWHEVPEPQRGHEREAIVRPLAVATCDLDRALIVGRAPFPLPIALGRSAWPRSSRDRSVSSPGDRVIVPFQISCGTCEPCRRGLTGNSATVSPRQMYEFGAFGGQSGGMLSNLALVPYDPGRLLHPLGPPRSAPLLRRRRDAVHCKQSDRNDNSERTVCRSAEGARA